ncbi:MAG: hypothetical protein FJX77_03625 [Armatimonadetes bacterium]|nr:hypothetical protein [Armatimonadota bacterium]
MGPTGGGPGTRRAVEAAEGVLKTIGLEEAHDHSKVMDRVASEFLRASTFPIADMVRLAQIAAKLGATIGASFRHATRDKKARSASEAVIQDPRGVTCSPGLWRPRRTCAC